MCLKKKSLAQKKTINNNVDFTIAVCHRIGT